MKKSPILYMTLIATIASSLLYIKVAALYHFCIVGFFALLFFESNQIVTTTKTNPIVKFFIYWFLYAVVSILWSTGLQMAAQYVYYILLIYMYVCIFVCCIDDKRKIISVSRFMTIITFVACCVGVWEMMTGNHLLKDYLDSPDRKRLLQFVPGFTFRNPNDFAMFLLQLIPFSFYGALFDKRAICKLICLINIVLSFVVASMTDSRTILIAVAIYTVVIFMKYMRKSWGKILLGAIVVLVVAQIIPQLNEIVDNAIQSISRDSMQESFVTEAGSGNTRIHLLLNCLIMMVRTGGFGVGAGNHRLLMPTYSAQYYHTGFVSVAHNFIGEFLADYGILMFILMIYLFKCAIKKIKGIEKRKEKNELTDMAFFLRLSILIFPLGSITVSSMIQMTTLWITIGFIAAYLNVCEKEFLPEAENSEINTR